MTWSKSLLSSFEPKDGANISFGNKFTGKNIGKGNTLMSKFIKFLEISLVEDLKYNLLRSLKIEVTLVDLKTTS